MFDSWGSFGTNNPGGPGPTDVLINNSTGVVGHWTATDLNNGNAHTGPAWNAISDVPLNAATGSFPKRVSVGPFMDTEYFQLAHPSVFEQTTFTLAIVLSIADEGNTPAIVGYGNGATGWFLQTYGAGTALTNVNALGASSGSALGTNTPGVFFAGFDGGTNTIYAQVNNGTVGTQAAGAGIIASTANTDLGRLVSSTGLALNGYVYEVWISTQTPSHTLFNSIYAEVLANGS